MKKQEKSWNKSLKTNKESIAIERKQKDKQTKTKQQRILNHARIHSDTVCKNKR